MQGEDAQESEGEDLPEEELPEEELPEEQGESEGEEPYPQDHGAAASSSSAPAEDGGAQDAGPGKAFEEGDYVQVFGLESAGGKQLNSRCGTIARYVEARDRFEVKFGRSTVVSLKPQNLRRGDATWSAGNPVRLVGLHALRVEPELRALSSCLGRLLRPGEKRNTWIVQVHSKERQIKCVNLKVCCQEQESYWRGLALSPTSKIGVALSLILTFGVMLEAQLVVYDLIHLRTGPIGAQMPGDRAARLGLAAVVLSLAWFVGILYGCYVMHESLKDPEVTFPQISELGVGPAVAKALYRVGFTAIAAVLASMILVHAELVLPHLPGGRHSVLGHEFSVYALLGAAGVALQGVFLLQPHLSLQTALHGIGAILFFYGTWSHMGTAEKLYLPSTPRADETLEHDEALMSFEAAEMSAFLQHPATIVLVRARHKILMRAPAVLFVLPLLAQFSDRMKATASTVVAPSMRSTLGLLQWLLVSDFVLIFVSYGLELMVAAYLLLPQSDV